MIYKLKFSTTIIIEVFMVHTKISRAILSATLKFKNVFAVRVLAIYDIAYDSLLNIYWTFEEADHYLSANGCFAQKNR